MTLADEMKALTEQGKAVVAAEQRREREEKKNARNSITERARQAVPEHIEKIIVAMKEHALKYGTSTMNYPTGECGDYVGDLTRFLVEELQNIGLKAKSCSQEHRPFGSDPYRWDTYSDVWIEVSW